MINICHLQKSYGILVYNVSGNQNDSISSKFSLQHMDYYFEQIPVMF